jgi:hypothetical protein
MKLWDLAGLGEMVNTQNHEPEEKDMVCTRFLMHFSGTPILETNNLSSVRIT